MCGHWWLSAIGYEPLGTTSTPKMVSLLPSSSYQISPTRDPKMNRSNTKKGFRRWNSIKVARDGRWINGRIPATSVTASAKGGHNWAADHRSFCLLPCASMDLGGGYGGGESALNPYRLLAMCGTSLSPIYGCWNPMPPSIWVDCHNSTAQ